MSWGITFQMPERVVHWHDFFQACNDVVPYIGVSSLINGKPCCCVRIKDVANTVSTFVIRQEAGYN